jgi:carbamoyltransferase
MSRTFGTYGPAFPRLGKLALLITKPFYKAAFAACHIYDSESGFARERRAAMIEKLKNGQTIYLLGAILAGHNSGVALVEVSSKMGLRVICNEEEERYSGIKFYTGHPQHSLEAVRSRMADLGLGPESIHACLSGWDYASFVASGTRGLVEHAPFSFALGLPASAEEFNVTHAWKALGAPKRFGAHLGLNHPLPIIAMRHHDNHAAFAYAVSPFAKGDKPVMVTVLDGFGDDAALSLYVVENSQLRCVRCNKSQTDSLGSLYAMISSTQGGWPPLYSEGRYMGATAWGDNNRMTNPFYRRLRQLVYFGSDGHIHINRRMANWHIYGEMRPYKKALQDVLGPPIARKDMWNPDAVLKVDDIYRRDVSQAGVDKAAALQMVFEDALFHIIDHLIQFTGSNKLVMSGGTALNCIANMRLLEHFDEHYFQRTLGKKSRLHLWVPPTPGDAGIAMGAAYNFALSGGVPPGEAFTHAFYCGAPPTTAEILEAIKTTQEIGCLPMGNVQHGEQLAQITDFLAYVVADDGVMGIFQGRAETGPRALGHRSIVANPCNPKTLDNMNRLVKFREPFRPLAPMATFDAAHHFFELNDGASDDDYNGYNYMVLTARARPDSAQVIPAVIHCDGTARVQIVRERIDPFCHAYLKAMGRRVGVEISVNTSLNVGCPIVQSPQQALQTLQRSKGMTGLVLVGEEGDAFLVWHAVDKPPKDAGKRLLALYEAWMAEWRNGGVENGPCVLSERRT